jgi:hypothetical protein
MKTTLRCPEGQHTMKLRKISLHFERNGFAADVTDVPVYICPKDGTRLIPGEVAEQVSEFVEVLFKQAQESPKQAVPFSSLVFQKAA